MLKVVGVTEPLFPTSVEGDEFVPLMARWGLCDSIRWQIVAPDRSLWLEIKINRFTGSICGLTVLGSLGRIRRSVGLSNELPQIEAGMPVVSRSDFDLNPDLVPQVEVAEHQAWPNATIDNEFLEISFDDSQEVTKWHGSSKVWFGTDEKDLIVAVRVERASIPASSPLALLDDE